MFSLTNKTAVITGASQGIGLAAAQRFAKAGATVVLADLKDCTEQAQAIGGYSYQVNVSNLQQMKDLMTFAKEQTGRLDVVFNNAGIATPLEPIEDVPEEPQQKEDPNLDKAVSLMQQSNDILSSKDDSEEEALKLKKEAYEKIIATLSKKPTRKRNVTKRSSKKSSSS